jgi:hypothetical protein
MTDEINNYHSLITTAFINRLGTAIKSLYKPLAHFESTLKAHLIHFRKRPSLNKFYKEGTSYAEVKEANSVHGKEYKSARHLLTWDLASVKKTYHNVEKIKIEWFDNMYMNCPEHIVAKGNISVFKKPTICLYMPFEGIQPREAALLFYLLFDCAAARGADNRQSWTICFNINNMYVDYFAKQFLEKRFNSVVMIPDDIVRHSNLEDYLDEASYQAEPISWKHFVIAYIITGSFLAADRKGSFKSHTTESYESVFLGRGNLIITHEKYLTDIPDRFVEKTVVIGTSDKPVTDRVKKYISPKTPRREVQEFLQQTLKEMRHDDE